MMNPAISREFAGILHKARLDRREVPRLTEHLRNLSLLDAYSIMDGGVELRVRAGERISGLKMGLTSRAKMEQMGLNQPIYGVLTDRMAMRNGDAMDLSTAIHPKIEPEIAFLFDGGLAGAGERAHTREEVIAACTGVTIALEILDSRYVGFKYFSLPDVIADNASSSHYVLGTWNRTPSAQLDLNQLKLSLCRDGVACEEATGSAILGDPWLSVVGLTEILASRKGMTTTTIPPGTVILAGAATLALPLERGHVYSVRAPGFDEVRIRC
ncbi:MAG: fumarylacetoacetate hydrolase family protein [Bdellovibrionota bacterium]